MFPSLQHNLKITTQLRMTPQLQQAVKLLQYNRAELVEFINTEMLENPTLEERPVEEPASDPAEGQTFSPSDDNKPIHSATAQSAEQASDAEAVHSTQIDWNRVDLNDTTHRFQAVRPVDDLPGYDQTLSRSETLTEHLSWQLRMLRLDEGVLEAAFELVHSLDEKGWFSEGIDGWQQHIAQSERSPELLERARAQLLQLDPVGVGALDLKECLLVQLRSLNLEHSHAYRLVDEHLELLGSLDLRQVARTVGISVDELEEAKATISTLEPRPGRAFMSDDLERNPFVTPDVHFFKEGDEWVVRLNEDGMPRLRVSKYYQRAYERGGLTPKEREYVIDRLRRAEWVTKCILQRQSTIRKVCESILRFQGEFFERGPKYLKPLVLRDVADDIEAHESTVSRVTSNKYAETPQGLLPLKYFFSARLASSSGGGDVSAEAVRQRIAGMIKSEDVSKPFSDSQIVKLLKAEGIEIARRTVAKYREQLLIPAAGKRRIRR
ncbi:MAG: RNA polymerase factor sigma-54 [Myxococcota bacterium]|nr:RNA polymerase factor sigma-54 [Myxococcota bacterium]